MGAKLYHTAHTVLNSTKGYRTNCKKINQDCSQMPELLPAASMMTTDDWAGSDKCCHLWYFTEIRR
ncbi:unnamed protein product [Chondrus crispus]|uniref:Uncharacterized protein n=1 Tax=Chondrus crispus TaxID=2769 RepID=R7QDS7_CHOCR|nr:unnamed protein product [Chondrus crispus]CDF36244.1 unnamed protein product [Chondrus crispus]|eukprot:XP_005716063.1 unnamed protein product [Chondrus crispus]